ncbi:MAG: hypothetical protein JWO03_2108 [Bacteroidetes bacterium]|nr:hypothetical protein [Bacteroidota bacterium]
MNRIYKFVTVLCLIIFCSISQLTFASNSPVYEQRRTDYIDTCLAHLGVDALPIQAYRNQPLDTANLYYLLAHIPTDGDADFRIVQAVRVLFLTQGTHQYDSVIMSSLNSVKYWINAKDSFHCYWSENHMCMWTSSDWLLHESYGRTADASLRNRLVHYLELKNQFGFYEFNSSVYLPYCLSGLLNLADFSQDAQIKSLATSAAQKLMSEYLIRLTNDKGVFYPTAGRNYYGKYESAYGQNHNNLIWLISGMGDMPGGASHCGAFLATSDLPVDVITNSWVPVMDTTYYNGHPLDSVFTLNAGQDTVDKVIFNWIGGAYFPPQVVYGSAALLTDSSLWDNYLFQPFHSLKGLPLSSYVSLSQELSVISKSSVNMGERLAIFKHNSITLSSIQDFFKGKIGFQQFPCVANVGSTAVFTASGPVQHDWDNRSGDNANYHLPYVEQHRNVALLMYRPEPVPSLLPYHNTDVALHWKTSDFDESLTDSLWYIGRQGTGYVAARMYCIGQIDSLAACHMDQDGSAYVIIVGDSALYGSFQHFKDIVHNSQFSDSRSYDSVAHTSTYFASIHIDTTTISYAWVNDSLSNVGIHDISTNSALHVYPNPAASQVTITLAAGVDAATIQVSDMMGRSIYTYEGLGTQGDHVTIDTHTWPQGMYVISGDSSHGRFTQKLVKE